MTLIISIRLYVFTLVCHTILQTSFAMRNGFFGFGGPRDFDPTELIDDVYIDESEVKSKIHVPARVSEKGRIKGSSLSSVPLKYESSWIKNIPKINFILDPIINFKIKQRFNHFGACMTLGMDYLSELGRWRFHCSLEDSIIGGRFSLRGSELGWAKSFRVNVGMGEDNTVKFKVRVGYNLKSTQAYARVRFRTEPVTPFDIGEGLSCTGRIPLPRVFGLFRLVPLRAEYRLRMTTPMPSLEWKRSDRDDKISFSTGIDRVDISLDELNFCLEWDERSPLWNIDLSNRISNPRQRRAISSYETYDSRAFRSSTSTGTSGGVGSGGGSRQKRTIV